MVTQNEIKKVLSKLNEGFEANIANEQSGSNTEVNEMLVDLSVARDRTNAIELSFPFTSLRVEEGTDNISSARILLNTRDDYQKNILISVGDQVECDRGIRKAFLYNSAQAGKFLLIKFFKDIKMTSNCVIVENQVSTVNVGYATAPLDGLTFDATYFLRSGDVPLMSELNSSAPMLTNILASSDYINLNVGNFTINGTLKTNNLKVPLGYSCEIIGFEAIVNAAISNLHVGVYYAIEGETIVNDAALIAMPRGVAYGNCFNCSVGSIAMRRPMVNSNILPISFRSNRNKRVFNQGELIVPYLYNIGALTTGSALVTMLFRLSKNIGV